MLSPERAVVVESGDALGRDDEINPALLGHLGFEIDERRFGVAVIPGRQRFGLGKGGGATHKQGDERASFSNGIIEVRSCAANY